MSSAPLLHSMPRPARHGVCREVPTRGAWSLDDVLANSRFPTVKGSTRQGESQASHTTISTIDSAIVSLAHAHRDCPGLSSTRRHYRRVESIGIYSARRVYRARRLHSTESHATESAVTDSASSGFRSMLFDFRIAND